MSDTEEARARFAELARVLEKEPQVAVGKQGDKKGFGSSALQVGGKIFAMLTPRGEFVVKLPKRRVEELEASGAGHKFDPGHGRVMKEWLVLEVESDGWLPYFREALQYVRGLSQGHGS